MSKVMTSLIAVLLVTSVSIADVSQMEGYMAALGNAVNLIQCQEQACSSNSLIIDNKQCAIGSCGASAEEFQLGVLNQAANGQGTCTAIGVLQSVASAGAQLQAIGNGCGPKAQHEEMVLDAQQGVSKAGGEGTGTANQFVAIAQGQSGVNCAGAVSQSSAVVGTQGAFVTGCPTAQGMAGSTTQVSTSQTQLVN